MKGHINVINKLKIVQQYMKDEGYKRIRTHNVRFNTYKKDVRVYGDGRVESMIKEDDISSVLVNKFSFIKKNVGTRDLGDIYVEDSGNKYPVNIKLYNPNVKSAGNMFGIYRTYEYIFKVNTGGSLTNLSKMLFQYDIEHWKKVGLNNYYFMFINKNDYKDIKYGSILTMYPQDIVVNPKNGFQCRFDKVRFYEDVHIERAIIDLLSKFRLYITKLAEPYLNSINVISLGGKRKTDEENVQVNKKRKIDIK